MMTPIKGLGNFPFFEGGIPTRDLKKFLTQVASYHSSSKILFFHLFERPISTYFIQVSWKLDTQMRLLQKSLWERNLMILSPNRIEAKLTYPTKDRQFGFDSVWWLKARISLQMEFCKSLK